ncbi:MAG: hypothetical protein R3C59_04540 [Planctomycetaceae bacterium]
MKHTRPTQVVSGLLASLCLLLQPQPLVTTGECCASARSTETGASQSCCHQTSPACCSSSGKKSTSDTSRGTSCSGKCPCCDQPPAVPRPRRSEQTRTVAFELTAAVVAELRNTISVATEAARGFDAASQVPSLIQRLACLCVWRN